MILRHQAQAWGEPTSCKLSRLHVFDQINELEKLIKIDYW